MVHGGVPEVHWPYSGAHNVCVLSIVGGALCAVPALCPRCAKSRLFFATGSHRSQGSGVCTPQPLLVGQGFVFL